MGPLNRLLKIAHRASEAAFVTKTEKPPFSMTKLHSGKVAAEDDFVEENEEPLADDPVLEE